MRTRARRPQFSSRPDGSATNVTSAIGLEETVGRLRARRTSLFTHTIMWITGLICLAFLLGTLAQAWSNSQLAQILEKEQQELAQVQAHHDSLTRMAEHYKNPAVIESEARQRLGYIRPGEQPVVFIGSDSQGQQKPQQPDGSSTPSGFWQEWWNLFFG